MEHYAIYTGGEFRQNADFISVVDPWHGETFALASKGSAEDLEYAIVKAQKAAKEMAALPSYVKSDILMQIASGMIAQCELLTALLVRESGKPWRYASAEMSRAITTFLIAAEETKRLPKEYIDLDWTPAGAGKEGLVKYFPLGLVGGISPFNFPINLAVHKIAPAIAAGCPIILKPSSLTPLSTLELARIIHQTALPKGGVSVIPMERSIGNQLASDERIKLLSFTGSPAVGWSLKNQAGKKKVVLELGGNAGVIVAKSADLNQAVDRCLNGGFSYSGQVCIHTQRIFIHDSLFDEFAGKLVEKTLSLKKGDPMDPSTEIASMIDEPNAIRIESWVNEALDEGAKLLCGGKRNGSCFEPTLLTSTNPAMKVCALEVFGPVVTLEAFSDFRLAVNRVNEGIYGLQAGIFTDSLDEMNFAFENLEVGGVIINDVPTFRVDHMPYGGVKNSGFGREGVRYAMLDMMEARLLVKPFGRKS